MTAFSARRIAAESRLKQICGNADLLRRFESYAEFAERAEAAEREAALVFHGATTAQKQALDGVFAHWYRDYSPRAERAREAARRAYEDSTAEAFDLFVVAVGDILRDSEISQETYAAWDQLAVKTEMEAA